MRTKTISVVLLLAFMGFTAACSKRPNDDTVAKDIQDKVAADPQTRDSQVTVAAKEGKVTLSGTVSTPAAQEKIEQFAHEEPGVSDVIDRTTVNSAAMAPASQTAETPAPAQTATHSPAPTPAAAPAPPPPAPKPQPIVIPAGTVLTVKTLDALSSKTSQSGQSFNASLAQSVSVNGKQAIAAGSDVSGTVVTAKSKGKIKGEGQLDLTLTSISVRGHTYNIHTEMLSSTVKGKGKRTAATTGGGAAGGALIGGIAGGGKGAAIGAGVGAAAGLVGGALTGNKQIEIPAEAALSFTLAEPLTLPPTE